MLAEVMPFIKSQLGANQFLSGAVLGGIFLGAANQLKGIPKQLFQWALARYTVTVSIDSHDDSFYHFQNWINSANFSSFSKRYSITSSFIRKRVEGLYSSIPMNHGSERYNIPDMLLTPMPGTYFFKYKKKWLLLECSKSDPTFKMRADTMIRNEVITIRYLGRSMALITEITNAIVALYGADSARHLSVYTPTWDNWTKTNILPRRSLDSVICKDGIVERVFADLTKFYASESWYAEMGIPYHRGYLFEGPPGCGKSSLIFALASHFDKTIYSLSLSSISSDNTLHLLLNYVPPGAILVIEDVDASFAAREAVEEGKKESALSFSTFINCIDGLGAKHGLVLFLTSNYPEKLDAALMRPGRTDMRVHLDHCNRKQIETMFLRFHGEDDTVRQIASDYADILSGVSVSPAELQEKLMRHRDSPYDALAEIKKEICDAN